MKIALNCCYYGRTSGGIKEYIYNLVTNIIKILPPDQLIFYISPDDEEYWKETIPIDLSYKKIPFKRENKIRRAILEKYFWNYELIQEKFDLFHSPFFHVPLRLNCKKIMTVHDLRFRKFPESYPFKRRLYLQYKVLQSLKLCDHIVAVSDFTKSEIIKYFNIAEDKITTIHEAININRLKSHDFKNSEFLKRYDLKNKGYILSVGHLEPRKNYSRLIDAYNNLIKTGRIDEDLVIIGKKNYKFKDDLHKIESSPKIKYLDFIDNEDLARAYYHARIFVFPSYYEGFGFPPLEAAAFSVPSAVSNTSSIPEICGEGAVYFDPFDVKDIQDKIYLLLSDDEVYSRIREHSEQNLQRFNWRKNAEMTVELYQRLVGNYEKT